MNDNKKLVKENWRDFEVLAFVAVKNELNSENIIKETLTDAIKDGGYDGEFILLSDKSIIQSLYEAKLRSNTNADLPLSEFAKSLIIAVTRHANSIYIVTNLYFSEDTLKKLYSFSECSELKIQLYNGYSVKRFIEQNRDLLKEINQELLDFLLSSNKVNSAQCIDNKYNEENIIVNIDQKLKEEFQQKLKSFNKKGQILPVLGRPYMGKTYYIEQFAEYLKSQKKNVQIIDVSKCLTYKEFFVELLSKAFGLSFELVDLLNDKNFEQAFQKIGLYNISKQDISMLKFIFSRQDDIDYDNALIFFTISNFFNKLFYNRKHKLIIAFLNLSLAEKEILQLIIYILKNVQTFSCILEITEDEYRACDNKIWENIKRHIFMMDNIMQPKVKINDWTINQAKEFLVHNIPNLSETNCKTLIQKFGCSPRELSSLIELINYSNLYENTPQELIFFEIMRLKIDNEDVLDLKCLEFLQLKNSDVLYIFEFLILFNGKIEREFLLDFFESSQRIDKCFLDIENSNLFYVTIKYISVKSLGVLDNLKKFCNNRNFTIKENVIFYTKNNLEKLHLQKESYLEIQINMTVHIEPEKCVKLLIELGNLYLVMEQLEKAYSKFELADELIFEQTINLDPILNLQLMIGSIKTLIWNLIKNKATIEERLKKTKKIINHIKINDRRKNDSTFLMLELDYFLMNYQFYHSLGEVDSALESTKEGIDLIENENLYLINMNKCGQMWRFYAISIKEKTKSIKACLKIFKEGEDKCKNSAKLIFGHVIHENMNITEGNAEKKLELKLKNYERLIPVEKELSIDEYLHYKKNVAAIYFNLKKYDTAQEIFKDILVKSEIFGITREEMRILNDMANIDWIKGKIKDARIKYCKAIDIAIDAGYFHNYWPILINYISIESYAGNFKTALEAYFLLKKYLESICIQLIQEEISPETAEYYRAALIIQINNLWNINQHMNVRYILNDIQKYCNQGNLCKCNTVEEIQKNIDELSLSNTMFEHELLDGKKVYLLKN